VTAPTAAPRPAAEIPPTLLQPLPRVLILKTGSTAPGVRWRHGDYDRWLMDALAGHDLAFDVRDATRPPLPDAASHAGILITGSMKSVLLPEPWMDALASFLAGAGRLGTPLLGICFGCQMLARARGGRVARNPSGREIGAVEVTLAEDAALDPLFEGLPSPLPVLATHEDAVETLPPGAVLLAGNAGTPIQAFRAADRVWGVQFHPEATPAILRDLIILRRERLEAEARARGADPAGVVAGLLDRLDRHDPGPARRLLANFARLCAGTSPPVAPM
jgi:GMP synthase (glutamine-hydrolysing)